MKSKTKISKQEERKANPVLVETLRSAKKAGSEFWLQTASILAGPRRNKIAVNLDEIDRFSSEGDTVIVPGKVLSQGEVSKKIAVVAFTFSEKAKEKLSRAKSQAIMIIDEIKKNPEGKGLRMFSQEE